MTQQLEISPTEVKHTRTSSPLVIGGAVLLLLVLMAIGIVPRLARQRDALAAVRLTFAGVERGVDGAQRKQGGDFVSDRAADVSGLA